METQDVKSLAATKIFLGLNLIEQLDQFKNVPGIQKIQRKIKQETKFLEKEKLSNTLVINHVMCSNLTHYEFLVYVLLRQRDLVHIDCAFLVNNKKYPIRIDIVCEQGAKWIKVIARNSKSISNAAKGGASFGVKSIVDQAEEYSQAAVENLYMFKKPQIEFHFSHNIDSDILEKLQTYDIHTITANNDQISNQININKRNEIAIEPEILNLDITTMLAYVSSLTNGNCNWIYQEPLLTEQGARERKNPLKPFLDNLFQGKLIICCQTALESFNNIISLLAGPAEHKRADALRDRLTIKKDIADIPNEMYKLKFCGKIKPRSLKIFAFGLTNKAITVTSNEGFIRSAKMKGINIPVIIHQARALTESKEKKAKFINNKNIEEINNL